MVKGYISLQGLNKHSATLIMQNPYFLVQEHLLAHIALSVNGLTIRF